MKKYISLLLLVVSMVSFAQEDINGDVKVEKKKEKKKVVPEMTASIIVGEGKAFYAEGKFFQALQKYKKALEKDANHYGANYGAAQIYYLWMNYKVSLKYIKKALEVNDAPDGEGLLLMGQVEHRMGNFEDAIKYYERAKGALNDKLIEAYNIDHLIGQAERAPQMIKDSVNAGVMNMGSDINSKYVEYSGIMASDGLTFYFTSRRSGSIGGKTASDGNNFEDIYKVTRPRTDTAWNEPTNEMKINTEGHENMTYLSEDGTYALLTWNTDSETDFKKIKNPTRSADIAFARLSDKGKWSAPKFFDEMINSDMADICATMTATGDEIYFMSTRKGGKGNGDIWYARKVAGDWSEPVNCGLINTSGDETTPFVSPDGKYLFFSSDAYEGMGGKDVYVVEVLGANTFSTPVNLGYPINSENDDIFFRYDVNTKKGYVSSVRTLGFGLFDIYEVDLTNWEIPTVIKAAEDSSEKEEEDTEEAEKSEMKEEEEE